MDLNLLATRLKTDYPVVHDTEIKADPSLAAVLVPLFCKEGVVHVLLIKRAGELRNHPGEISFPGGKYDEADGNFLTTALRETREELDLEIDISSVVSRLPDVDTLTGFVVSPFVAILENLPPCKRNPDEVDQILEAPLEPLLATQERDTQHKASMDMVIFQHGPHRIWGATAKILRRISTIC